MPKTKNKNFRIPDKLYVEFEMSVKKARLTGADIVETDAFIAALLAWVDADVKTQFDWLSRARNYDLDRAMAAPRLSPELEHEIISECRKLGEGGATKLLHEYFMQKSSNELHDQLHGIEVPVITTEFMKPTAAGQQQKPQHKGKQRK